MCANCVHNFGDSHSVKQAAMLYYSKDGITVSPFLDDRKENIKGTYPVKIRVTYKRVRKYYSTGKTLSPEEWDKLPVTRTKRLTDIRKDIENSFSLVKSNVVALAEKGAFSFDALNVHLSHASGTTLNLAFRTKIEALTREERVGTMLYYDNILKNVEAFGGKSIPIESVTVDWLQRFEKFLLKDKNHTTVGMHMRAIRAVLNEARKSGGLREARYPFGKGKYEIKTGESRKLALSLDQIARIMQYKDGQDTERYRDIWFFMYLCNGINTADLVRLKYSNIIDGEICYIRQKTVRTTSTVKEIRAIVTPQMQEIIDRWGNPKEPDHLIFPLIRPTDDPLLHKKRTKDLTKRINEHMKKVARSIGVDNISTYTARHSYATVLKRSGANIAYISESLGHSSLKTTESYLASFEKEERQKNAELLTKF